MPEDGISLYVTFSFIAINIWELFTFRIWIMAILVLPLLTLLIFLPFFHSLSKDRQETLGLIGFLGFYANIVLCVECVYRIIYQFITILFFNKRIDFEFKYFTFGLTTLVIAILSYHLSGYFYSIEVDSKDESEVTSLNLNK